MSLVHTCGVEGDGLPICAACAKDSKRRPLDFYETPLWQTESLINHVPINGTIFEPCAGDGAIVRGLEQRGGYVAIYTNDIDESRRTMLHGDATKPELWRQARKIYGPFAWIISNPPFNVAFEILQHAYEEANFGVAFLLRISFLEPTRQRAAWLAAHPPNAIGVLPRWSYKANGKTDSATTAWMVWSPVLSSLTNWIEPSKPK